MMGPVPKKVSVSQHQLLRWEQNKGGGAKGGELLPSCPAYRLSGGNGFLKG